MLSDELQYKNVVKIGKKNSKSKSLMCSYKLNKTNKLDKVNNRIKQIDIIRCILEKLRNKYPYDYEERIIKSKLGNKWSIKAIAKTDGTFCNIYLITLPNKMKVVMKLYTYPIYQLMLNEYQMYSVFNAFVKYNISPFVLTNIPIIPYEKSSSREYYPIFTTTYNNLKTIYDFLLKGQDKKSYNIQLKCVIFQILYTLECMNRVGLRHSDLHTNNIFVLNLQNSKNKVNKFIIDGNTYYIPLSVPQVRIFDLDRSIKNIPKDIKVRKEFKFKSSRNSIENIKNKFGKKFGNTKHTNTFNTFKILYHIYEIVPKEIGSILKEQDIINYFPKKLNDFKNKHFLDSQLFKEYGMLYHKSKIVKEKKLKTNLYDPQIFKSPGEILKSPYFYELREYMEKNTIVNETYSINNIYG